MGAGDSQGNTVGDVHGDVTQIRDVHGDVHIGRPGTRRWPRVLGGVAVASIVLAAALIGWRVMDREKPSDPPAATDPAPHLSITTSVSGVCGYLVPEDGEQRACPDGSAVALTGQNSSSAEVVVTGIRVQLRSSRTAVLRAEPDRAVSCPNDPLPLRNFGVDLEETAPQVRPNARRLRPGGAAETTSFPYRVRRGEPEVFLIGLSSKNCDCRFALVVDWVANGEQKSTTTGDFRVVPR